MPYKWETIRGDYSLEISCDPWNFIQSECENADSIETGGILIGFYSGDRTTAKDSRMGRNWFTRGIAGLKMLLARRWKNSWKTFYIGEWHFHPDVEIVPSKDDFKQMQEISQSTNYQCAEPIMLIIGKEFRGEKPVRIFIFPRGKIPLEYYRIVSCPSNP
jgi:hypothetical protein